MANGRLGAKCIPAYKSCEVYQNSSGSEASVSIVAQSTDSSVNNSITVAAASTQYCINPSRCEGHVGTNCYVDTAALTIAGTARTELSGAFISSSGTLTVGSCTARYPNITSYINPCDGTKTSIAATSICFTCQGSFGSHGRAGSDVNFCNGPIAAYGGNEVILPVEGMIPNVRDVTTTCSATSALVDCLPCDFFLKYDCNTRGVLLIDSKFYCCCYQCAGALFIDASSRCGKCGYDCTTYNRCSIVYQSYCNCSWCEVTGCCHQYLATINHYAMGMYQPTTVLGGVVELRCGSCCLEFCCNASLTAPQNRCSFQSPITGFSAGDSDDSKSTFISFSARHMGQFFQSSCCWFSILRRCTTCACCCKSLGYGIHQCIGTVLNCSGPCCEEGTGSLYSPYGFQRGATYGLALMHVRTCSDGKAGYVMWDPVGNFGDFPDNCCTAVNWSNFKIKVPATAEFPVKWLAHNPKSTVEKTYFMSRGNCAANCGIFEYDWQTFSCFSGKCFAPCGTCNISYGCNQVMMDFEEWTCSCLITKVADFPSAMTGTKYTNPKMCVGCLYRMGTQAEPFWSISIYNHDTSGWDRFTTDDLLTWNNSGTTFNWNVATTCSLTANASCIVSLCNGFADAVPKCGYMDHGVSANNYERTGIVLSDGDSIYVNNCTGTAGLAVQVWGYEG